MCLCVYMCVYVCGIVLCAYTCSCQNDSAVIEHHKLTKHIRYMDGETLTVVNKHRDIS